MRAARSGFAADQSCVTLTYDVRREPEIRREVSQLQRWEGSGSLECGTVKVWVAELQEHETLSSCGALIFGDG